MDTDRLDVNVQRAGPSVQMLRAAGPLSLATATTLNMAAEKALAEQPDLLVIDLSRVVLRERIAVRLLPLIAARASVWPVTRVAVAGAMDEIERPLRRSPRLSPLGWFPDAASAVRSAAERPLIARTPLPSDESAVRKARQVVAATCGHGNETREPAEIVVTELVGNALQHAHGPMELRVAYNGRAHISVLDGEPDFPVDVEAGYGLDVVRRFAIVWGWRPAPGGKVVWAVVGRPPRTPPSVRVTHAR